MKTFKIQDTNGKEVELGIRKIAVEEWEESDRVFSAKIAELASVKNGMKVLSRQQLHNFFKENGIWTESDQAKADAINKEISALLKKLKNSNGKMTVNQGREVCVEIIKKREELAEISQKRQHLDHITLESMAEQEKINYLVYISTVYKDSGKNYWLSFEDMKNDRESVAYEHAARLLIEDIYGYDPHFEKNLPENKWLLKYGLRNEKMEFVDRKTGERVDIEGKKESEVVEEIKEKLDALVGEIQEENPFLDDETNEPVIINVPETKTEEKIDNKGETNQESKEKEAVVSV